MADLEMRIVDARHSFEDRTLMLESKMLGTLFRLDKHDLTIADLLERVRRLEKAT